MSVTMNYGYRVGTGEGRWRALKSVSLLLFLLTLIINYNLFLYDQLAVRLHVFNQAALADDQVQREMKVR